jgi:hypothetical protein
MHARLAAMEFFCFYVRCIPCSCSGHVKLYLKQMMSSKVLRKVGFAAFVAQKSRAFLFNVVSDAYLIVDVALAWLHTDSRLCGRCGKVRGSRAAVH